jgi:hypothetical protein
MADHEEDNQADKGDSIKLPHMPLWVYQIDTDRDCRGMPDATFGRYMRLLIRQWIEGCVPATPAEAMRDAMLDPGSEGDIQSLLDRKFSIRDGSVRRNGKCDEERQEAIRKVLLNREHARKGGRAKALASAKASAKASAHLRASGSVSESESLPELPERLRCATVKAALAEWIAHRREIRKKFTKRAAGMCFKKWTEEGWTPERVVRAIEHSIGNTYTGICEPAGGGGVRTVRATADDEKRRIIQELRSTKENAA